MITEAFCLETNEMVPIEKYDVGSHKTLLCKYEHKLMVKRGKVTKHHYAHYPGTKCIFQPHSKTSWHRQWQSIDSKNTEVYMKSNIKGEKGVKGVKGEKGEKGEKDANDEKHFADIVTEKGVVIEIQHSPIKHEKIVKRENFYKNLIWIFNVNSSHTNTSFICRTENLCIIKIERNYLLDTNSETYYDCGAYLLKKIGIIGQNKRKKYVLCEIVEYVDFIGKHFSNINVVFPKDNDFEFSFIISNLSVTYFDNKITKLYFETLNESNEELNNYEPFLQSKYIEGRYFLPF